MNLTLLANKFRSDKGTRYGAVIGAPAHKYTYLYDLVFFALKHKELNFLEMGLAVGGPELGGQIDRHVVSPSVEMWMEYFSKANIFGFDISDFSHLDSQRFRFVRGDLGSRDDLMRLCSEVPDLDVIIDDASHASYHQQLALRYLWKKLSPGGLYVIEDLNWQPTSLEARLPMVPKTALILENLFDRDTYIESEILDNKFLRDFKADVFSYSSFPAFGGPSSKIYKRIFEAVRKKVVLKLIILRKL